ncbi:5'-nucleotidase C-terminal domain-containing protein [uncultured Paracoccus sp.]|uniref:bifunctional metallophosphatase/5'-nucleotidase n=1 Tax=uncultured Paracoccus sp. TaxID=189685 RepID=UPI002623E8F3|nr:5'-nucleotidase C-terminal domain-containing protein [uncultured Paracoccus sp.]
MPNLTLLQINDVHVYLEPHAEIVWTGAGPETARMGGYARIASIFKAAREENPGGVLAMDCGDSFHGTPALVESKGRVLVPVLNALGLSAMTGHWDFAWGPEHLRDLAGGLDFPLLAANCHDGEGRPGPFPPTESFEVAGVRVGVIGLAATILGEMPPQFAGGLRFTDGIEEAREHAARLRDAGCGLVVVVSHLGFPQDCALAEAVDGLDVILSGHTHNRVQEAAECNGTLIIQSGCHGSFVGRLDLQVEGGRVTGHRHRLIPVTNDLPEDPAMVRLVSEAVADTAAMRDRVVGHTAELLHRATTLSAPMDDVLLAAIAAAAGTEIAFSNGWRYGAPIPPGPVTEHDLFCIVPMNPPVETVDMTSAEIRDLIEASLEAVFSRAPFGQRGGYLKRMRGLTIDAKIENPKGLRTQAIYGLDGRPLRDGDIHKVAFISRQGVPSRYDRNRTELPVSAIEALRKWFSDNDRVAAGCGRARLV